MLKRSSDIALQITETADLKLTLKIKKYPVIFANIKNARFTGSSAGGSKSIKLAQVIIPLGSGFTIGATLYLEIRFDGTINLKIMQSNAYELTIKRQAGSVTEQIQQTCQRQTRIHMSMQMLQ